MSDERAGVDYALSVMSGEARGAIPSLLRGALSVLSVVYGIGLAAFLLPYRLGIRKRKRLTRPVISIGNLTFGGTGKTPTVRTIAAGLVARGVRPAILSRGHGGSGKGKAAVVSDGKERLLPAEQCGDEPAMLADLLPGVPVLIGKDRWESGSLAIREFDPEVILLDDGLQYWQLHRDVDVVLINAAEPFGYGKLMPRGALREPVSGLQRAAVVVVTNSDKVSPEELARIHNRVAKAAPKRLIVNAEHRPSSLRGLDGSRRELDWLRGRRVCALCSIGAPELFAQSLRELGAVVVKDFSFPDHHLWHPDEIAAINTEAEALGAEVFVTTEKDAVKLTGAEPRLPMVAVDIIVEFRQTDLVATLLDLVKRLGTKQ